MKATTPVRLFTLFLQLSWLLMGILDTVTGSPPHFVVILADDLGWNDIGYHGSEIKTGILDRLASRGVTLENYYVQPACTPSRASFLTGRYPIYTGLQHSVLEAGRPSGIPLEMPTLADKLQDVGYRTHAIGKWHVGFYKKEYLPTNRGFDTFYGYYTGSEDHFVHDSCSDVYENGTSVCGVDLHDNETPDYDNTTYSTTLYAQKAVERIEDHALNYASQSMFMYLAFQAPHAPMQVPSEYLDRTLESRKRKIFAGMVNAVDEAVGKVTDSLKAQGLWDNTILIFSTDNGGGVTHGSSNWPLRGQKGTLFEGGIRAVGFVNSPLLKDVRGTISDGLIHISDWLPTLLELAGGNTTGLDLDGYNVWEHISKGEASPRTELLHNIDPMYALHGTTYMNGTFDNQMRAAIRYGDWKLITGKPGKGEWYLPLNTSTSTQESIPDPDASDKNLWLFNITNDPLESTDMSADEPGVVSMLLDKLAGYNSAAVAVNWPDVDGEADPNNHGGVWGPWIV